MIYKKKVMNKTKKVRCPHCKKINSVIIPEELKKHKEPIYRRTVTFKKAEVAPPKTIAVTCSNPECKKSFKIEIA